jgi:hypothetical protein
MTTLSLPAVIPPITPGRFYEIVSLLNPEIHSLRLHKSIIQNLPHTQDAIAALDAALPNLEKLVILHTDHRLLPGKEKAQKAKRSYVERVPLSGLPKLRNFAAAISGSDTPQVGRYMCRLGGEKTVHQDLDCNGMRIMGWSANMAHEVKPYVLNRRTYHYGDGYKMHPEEEQYQDSEPEVRVESEWGDNWVTRVPDLV